MTAGGTSGGPADRYLLFGCRTGYAGDVAEIVLRSGGVIAALVDNLAEGEGDTEPSPYGPVIRSSELGAAHRDLAVLVPLLTPGFRRAVEGEARDRGLARFPTLVDPTATVASTAVLGEGTVVNAGVVVGASSTFGRFVHVNRSASLAHDLLVEDFVSIGPAATLSGSVVLRRGVFVGSGAVAVPGVTIGANSIVGAGSVVVRDVPAHVVVAGNPARVIRDDIEGYGNVAV